MVEEDQSGNVERSATQNEYNDVEKVVAAHIPSPSAVCAMLSDAEEMCDKCNIPIAASSLRRAKGQIE